MRRTELTKTQSPVKRAIIYVRVSTDEQVDNFSLETQENICKKEANKRGLQIVKIFREEGRSAKTIQGRPVLLEMLEFCRRYRRQIDAVIIYRIDRISRRTQDYLTIKSRLANYQIRIISTAAEPTGDSPIEQFLETILAGFAQLDNDIRSERAKNGMRARFNAGLHNGIAPLGYLMRSGYVIKNPENFETIKSVWEFMAIM